MSNEIETIEQPAVLTARDIQSRVNLIQEVMKQVMKDGTHFGIIPGCPKPSLFKAGAEKLASTFQMAVESSVEDLSTSDEKRYRVTCTAYALNGTKLGSAIGECSSGEEKFKWRRPVCDQEFDEADIDRKREKWTKNGKIKQIRTEPADQANTILQMADKRAYVAVVRKVTAASDIFTQDIEDLDEIPQDEPLTPAKTPVPMPKPKAKEPSNGDFVLMKSKYQGYCKSCQQPITVGEEIYYSKQLGSFHKNCKDNRDPGAEG